MNNETVESGARPRGRAERLSGIGIILVLLAAAAVYLVPIRRDLPYLPLWDEPAFVQPAVRMASTNDLNPRWFSHPGSTVIYPLAALYWFSGFADRKASVFSPAPGIRDRFENCPGWFYLSGRMLITLFALAAVYLSFLVGRLVGGGGMGVLAGWLVLLSPTVAGHANVVRTDSASLFFTLAAVYAFLRLGSLRRPADHLLAGAAVGLATATKYSLGPLVIVLLAVQLALVIRAWRRGEGRRTAGYALAGLAAAPAFFLLATPGFLFNLETVLANLRSELRSEHLGQDGFTFWGNLGWYLGREIPRDLGWPRLIAALAGLAAAVRRRDWRVLLCAGTALVLLAGISTPDLHWGRWLIPILPLICLLAAYGVVSAVRGWSRFGGGGFGKAVLLAAVMLAVSWPPAVRIGRMVRTGRNYSTRVRALKWAEENIPPGSCLVQEWWTWRDYPVKDLQIVHELRLADHPVEYYSASGCRYLLANSQVYDSILSAPDRYPGEAAFYRRLFGEAERLAEFTASRDVPGPTIRIYRLAADDD